MLRKIYLISPEYVDKKPQSNAAVETRLPQLKSGSRKKHTKHKRITKNKTSQPPYYKWVKMSHQMQEADISRKTLIQKIADFLQTVLPSNTPQGTVPSKIEKPYFTKHSSPSIHTDTASVWASPSSLPSTSHEIIYETSKRSGEAEEEETEDEGASYVHETEVTEFSNKHFGSVASPYVSSKAYRARNVHKDFGIRREADGSFRIGNSIVDIDPKNNVYVQGKIYEGTPELFELLTRKKVNHSLRSTKDLKNYRQILNVANAHRENHEPSGVIKTTRGIKFNDVIAKLFPGTRQRRVKSALIRQTVRY